MFKVSTACPLSVGMQPVASAGSAYSCPLAVSIRRQPVSLPGPASTEKPPGSKASMAPASAARHSPAPDQSRSPAALYTSVMRWPLPSFRLSCQPAGSAAPGVYSRVMLSEGLA